MKRFPLLILLLAHLSLSLGCDTGVAYAGQSLSLYRSSLANADVALLTSYNATDVNGCLNDCCTEKYGSCSVASFKKNATGDNCQLFNCRPVKKCKFVSSSTTDSFSFSSKPVLVPSAPTRASNSSSPSTTSSPPTDAPKDDNATVKPRKGVGNELDDIFGNGERSGVKPRKGVSPEGVGGAKSKVKPRKGVGPQPSTAEDTLPIAATPSQGNEPSLAQTVFRDVVADDLVSALEKVFEDDVKDKPVVTSSKDLTVDKVSMFDTVASIRPSSSVDYSEVIPTSLTTLQSVSSSSSVVATTSGLLLPSLATSRVATSSARTPFLHTTGVAATGRVPAPSSPTILEHSRLIFHEVSENLDSQESESERKYNSSMHLVLSLVFGLLILVSVLGVVAKRIYDSWMRRHYRRMDFLIDGMYNGYG